MEASMSVLFFLWYKIKAACEKMVCIGAVSQPCFPFRINLWIAQVSSSC